MLQPRGPRTDVARMNPLQRLTSALVFLLWGTLLLGLWLLIAYLAFGLKVVPGENPMVLAALFGLAILTAGGILGGLYLLVRAFF